MAGVDDDVQPVEAATTDAVVHLGKLVLDFGQVERMTYHADGKTPESDTTHTVMLGLVACALADRFYPGLRKGLIAQFALVHDLPEVYAGDTPTLHPQTDDDRAAKEQREREAQDRLRAEFRGTLPWISWAIMGYEALEIPEARFVKAVDKFLPKITHILNAARTITEQGMSRAQLAARYQQQGEELDPYLCDFPEMEELRRQLVQRVLDIMDQEEAEPGG